MKINKFDNDDEWLQWRRGKVTGSKLKDIAGSSRGYTKSDIKDELDKEGIEYGDENKAELYKMLPAKNKAKLRMQGEKNLGYYEVLAEQIAIPEDDDIPAIERGNTKEEQAIERFEEETGHDVVTDLVTWQSEKNEISAISPDGYMEATEGDSLVINEAVEVKCPKSKRFLKAWMTGKIPGKYWPQVLQYFIVNPDLEVVHFVFHDDRMPIDTFWYTVERHEAQDDIAEFEAIQEIVAEDITKIEDEFTFTIENGN